MVADGVVELPKSAQEKIADLGRQLGDCLGRPQPADHLPTDPDGTLAKACPAEMAAIDAYAASRELNAAGIVRFLTADALEQCGRLGRPADGVTAAAGRGGDRRRRPPSAAAARR